MFNFQIISGRLKIAMFYLNLCGFFFDWYVMIQISDEIYRKLLLECEKGKNVECNASIFFF